MTDTALPEDEAGARPVIAGPALREPMGATRSTGRMVVIWNPSAGGGAEGDVDQRRTELKDALAAHGVDAELFVSASEAESERRVDQAIGEGAASVVAAGGDGTVRSIAFHLLDCDVPLGILPLGTAMNVARSVGIPLELEEAVTVLATGTERAIDVGEVRGTPFLEVASIGLGAEVLAKATEVSEGRLHAVLDGLRDAVRSRRTRARLQLDGREVRSRVLSIAVANGQYTGRGLEIAPEARLDDGRFDVLLFEGFGGLGLAVHLASLLLGRTRDPRIRRYRAATVSISTRRPLRVRLDSQDIGTTPVELVTRRGALRVIVPRSTIAEIRGVT